VSGGVLLTGATGFVGMELLCRYLERSDRHVYALVRAGDSGEAEARLGAVIEGVCGDRDAYRGRSTAVPGDIQRPGLGLDPRARRWLAERVDEVLHGAATVSFSLPLPQSREVNVEGTRRLLEFAEQCQARGGLRCFSHISTAYVAGDHPGTFSEEALDVGQGFRNGYERSKFEAERLVSGAAERLPVKIFRPSIIVGEKQSGWTASFNVLYPPLKAFQAGSYPALPARRSTPVDIVPVDFVADAIFELAGEPAESGEVNHLVAGPRATTVGRLVDLAAAYFQRPAPRLIPPRLYRRLVHPILLRRSKGRRRRALERTEALFPYYTMRVRFENWRTEARLRQAGIKAPAVDGYLGRLLDFAVASRWGRSPLSRVEARRGRVGRRPSFGAPK
jgi:thioester reductase-like protein